MSCFSCLKLNPKLVKKCDGDLAADEFSANEKGRTYKDASDEKCADSVREKGSGLCGQWANVAQSFTFRELAASTQNFRAVNLIGEGGFESVYKGRLESGKVFDEVLQLENDMLIKKVM